MLFSLGAVKALIVCLCVDVRVNKSEGWIHEGFPCGLSEQTRTPCAHEGWRLPSDPRGLPLHVVAPVLGEPVRVPGLLP